jgi:hypothetical protein
MLVRAFLNGQYKLLMQLFSSSITFREEDEITIYEVGDRVTLDCLYRLREKISSCVLPPNQPDLLSHLDIGISTRERRTEYLSL